MNVRPAIPLLIQYGWLRHQEKDARPPQRRRRGGWDYRNVSEMPSLDEVPFPTTPSAPLKEASRLLLDVASTPPMSGGEWRAQFMHTFFDTAYRHYLDTLQGAFQAQRHQDRPLRTRLARTPASTGRSRAAFRKRNRWFGCSVFGLGFDTISSLGSPHRRQNGL